ncbi:hypothetical protein JCGZ_00035 [Jatropha curcas]|uniref:Treslin N-terminal domain-containing protein n=1 Tax=Jatropha curcas TaxID=180498 RepID=A0A067J8T6_JATCU|nr:hypothetical protein JCGZ_00035 [Jatropha curcas]
MAVIDSITDYSRTQRVVLLIDLNPFLYLEDQNPYLASLLSTARTLLSFPPLSSSLFSFKPFFSSLSPILSSSKLNIPSLSLSFNHPNSTLESLTQTLTSLLSTFDRTSISSLSPRAFHLASSMRQLVHDYPWDSVICDSLAVIRSSKCFSEFLSVELDDECLSNVDGLIKKFREFFESVNEAFVTRDIQFSWIDMKYEIWCCADKGDFVEPELEFGLFKSGIRDLGWGFCSSEAIVLGSALIPFGLIYPSIGILPRFFNLEHNCKSINAQLSLKILDVSGNPLECKCCDIELVSLNMFNNPKFMDQPSASCEKMKRFWGDFSHGITKLHVNAVFKHDKRVQFDGLLSDPILVRELPGVSKKDRKESCSGHFEDRVLEMLGMEIGKSVSRKSPPLWEILFSFLYREDCWALVSLSNGNGNSLSGVLKPFTISLVLLLIIRDEFNPHGIINEFDRAVSGQFVIKTQPEICNPNIGLSHSIGLVGSQSGSSPSDKPAEFEDGKRKKKKKKKDLHMLQELTWSAFCKAALEHLDIDLEDVCFARGYSKSKKLKFLKCWMKQMKKSSTYSLTMPDRSKLHQDIPKEMDNRFTKLSQESEQPIASCSSVGEDSLTGASRIQDEVALGFSSGTLESFFNDIPHKIQQGLESEEIDLGSLANRLVSSSIYWLYKKYEKETLSESEIHAVKSDDPSTSIIAAELTKLLLRDPKDLAAIYKGTDPSFRASNLSAATATSENIVRDLRYELQILFRMEILQSEVGPSFGESTKQKYVKQICFFLENIQWHLQGGFFGDWSLDKYVENVINSRYCQSLGDVVQRIYTKMDLLLFEDEDESPNPLLNSEDSNQSRREKHKDEMDENCRSDDPFSAELQSFQPMENEHQSPRRTNHDEHARKLIEAQERRQRARRFSSFNRGIPDLQRVWAPKQPKTMKVKSNPLQKLSKRKEWRSVSYDTVCETPLMGTKYSCRSGSSSEKDRQDNGTGLCGSVSKALFQDDSSQSNSN